MTPAEVRGLKIKRARERLGWTQKQLASYISASHKSVSNWERGATSPRNRTGALEAVLGISLNGDGNGPGPTFYPRTPLEEAIWAETSVPPDVRRDIIQRVRQAQTPLADGKERPPA